MEVGQLVESVSSTNVLAILVGSYALAVAGNTRHAAFARRAGRWARRRVPI